MNEIITTIKRINETVKQMPGIENPQQKKEKVLLEDVIHDNELKSVIKKLFGDGHHARAVEEGFKFLNNLVKNKAQLDPSFDGAKLMKQTFSVNNPVLMLNSGTSNSEKDEQLGYMEIFSGCITGIRNPRAHEHDWEDTEQHAIQLLVLADHLVERVRNTKKA